MAIRPTPWTAAAAGIVAALAWPFLANRFGGGGGSGGWGAELIVLSLIAIALPAHLFVLGMQRPERPSSSRSLDQALMLRIGAWVAAAVATTLARSAVLA